MSIFFPKFCYIRLQIEYFEYLLTVIPEHMGRHRSQFSGESASLVTKAVGEHPKVNLLQAAKAAYGCQGTRYGTL